MAQVIKNLPTNAVQSLGGCENHVEKKMQSTPVFLPGKSHRQKSLVAIVHGVTKSQTRLSMHAFSLLVHRK